MDELRTLETNGLGTQHHIQRFILQPDVVDTYIKYFMLDFNVSIVSIIYFNEYANEDIYILS